MILFQNVEAANFKGENAFSKSTVLESQVGQFDYIVPNLVVYRL